MSNTAKEISKVLRQYLKFDAKVELNDDGITVAPIPAMTPGMEANAWFFSHPKWGPKYFDCENYHSLLNDRWVAAAGSWDSKVVVDMGCGPGNLFRSVDGSPKVLIGVDISSKALMHARELGYTPLLADVHDTPLNSGFADLVTANAVLHHIDDVAAVLTESARLVKPGGMLITDEDPLACEYTLRGLGRFTSYLRSCIPLARVRNHPHRSWKYNSFREQRYRLKTEIHNRFPGDGIKKELFHDILEPLGFTVKLYPHSMIVGKSVFEGDRGHSSFWLQMTQRLAGMDAEKTESGLSVMCVAKRNRN